MPLPDPVAPDVIVTEEMGRGVPIADVIGRSSPYGESGKSMLCITVINHLPPSFVRTRFNNPFLGGMSRPSEFFAPVISHRASTAATSGLKNLTLVSVIF